MRPRARHVAVLLLLGATVWGASSLAFLCDDAFITFRYVRNAHDGLGLVWNPPPFQPVEGYTGFLWALLLWAAWSWFGIEPPVAANPLSLFCGIGQFLVVALFALRLRRRDGSPLPTVVGLVTLAAIVANRTFLQWMSSGLETALSNLAFVTWVLLAFRRPEHRTARWLALWSAAATVAALTRPDGLLLVAATAAAALLDRLRRRERLAPLVAGLAPLALVLAHVAWRRSFYGEWLPNTYYAKVVAPWPEAGVRYFGCFAIENGVWLWLPLAALWVVVECRRAGRHLVATLLAGLPAVAAVTATLCHAGYYLLLVGGDHFEYRVLSQLVPLGLLAGTAMAARLTAGIRLPLLTATALGLAGTVGWLHLALTRDIPLYGFQPVAARLPALVQPLARWYDRQQLWLSLRLIGQRCNHHANLLAFFAQQTPPGLRLVGAPDPFPMAVHAAVGLAGWSLHACSILDTHGLNDWVIARMPTELPPAIAGERFAAAASTADVDHDGQLDRAELRQVLQDVTGAAPTGPVGDVLLGAVIATHAEARPDAVPVTAAAAIGDLLDLRRSMAHERRPPPGYFEAFAPNVVVTNGVARAEPRQVPMTADRIRAIEAEWRATVARARRR